MTLDAAVEQTCPRCGSSAAGAPWCPSCGLNLRLHTQEAEAPPPAASTPPAAPVYAPPDGPSRRRPFALIAGGVLVLGGAIAAVAVLVFRSSPSPSAVTTTVVQTVAVTQRGATTQIGASTLPLVTVAEMHDVLLAYVNAYAAEDSGALGRLFASDLVRQNGADPIENRDAALATYQRQFDQLTNPHYSLTGIQYAAGRGEGSAAGTYAITSAAGRTGGSIEFHFVLRGGGLLIDAIRVVPS
jgi:hypothetical protein